MAEILLKEAPGGVMDCYQCPTCSQMFSTVAVENGEPQFSQKVEAPSACRRCGSPMDIGKALAYQNEQAVKDAEVTLTARRRTVKV